MVRVEATVPDPGVMAPGENEQLKLLGRPLQESEMALLKAPDCDSAATVKLPDFPAGIVMDDGDAVKDNVDEPGPAAHPGL
jgi:hypothetical protein